MSSTLTRRVTVAAAAVAAGAVPLVGAAAASAATTGGAPALGSPLMQPSLGQHLLGSIPVVNQVAPTAGQSAADPSGLVGALAPGSVPKSRPATHPLIPTNSVNAAGLPATGLLNGATRSALPTTGLIPQQAQAPVAGAVGQLVSEGVPAVSSLTNNTANSLGARSAVPATRSALPTSPVSGGAGALLGKVTNIVPGGSGVGTATRSLPSLGTVTQSLPGSGLTRALPAGQLTSALGATPLGGTADSLGQF